MPVDPLYLNTEIYPPGLVIGCLKAAPEQAERIRKPEARVTSARPSGTRFKDLRIFSAHCVQNTKN